MNVSLPVVQDKKKTISRSKAAKWRWIVLATVQALLIAHLIHWLVAGRTMTPIEPSESMEFMKRGVINAGTIFFALALLSTLVLGRWFCGWGCHVVLLQDLCSAILKRMGIRPKPFRSRLLIYVPFVLALYMFVWPVVFRWGVEPIWARLATSYTWIPVPGHMPPWALDTHLITDDFWRTFTTVAVAIPFLLVCSFAVVYFFGNKGFCTYGCPYGGFFAPLEQFSPMRIRVNDSCEHCGHCTAVCSSNVRVHDEVRDFGMVVDPGCMKCLDCVSVCPNDALFVGLGKPASSAKPRVEKPARARPDLSWGEEIGVLLVFVLAFFGFRSIYGLVPMLMAVGIALCVTFLVWKTWCMMRKPNVNFHRFRLRHRGRVRRSGVVVALSALLGIVLTAHGLSVKTVQYFADRADTRVRVPRAQIFTLNPVRIDDATAADVRDALGWFDLLRPIGSGGLALMEQPGHDIRRAWLHACLLDFEEAERLMRRHNERFGEQDAICRDIALLMRMTLRDEEAARYSEDVVARQPEFILTLDGILVWLDSEGRFEEAITLVREGLEHLDPEARGHDERRLFLLRRLSLLELNRGNLREGIRLVRETIEIDATNPASYLKLAQAHQALGEIPAALTAIDEAIGNGVESPDLLEYKAQLLESIGRGDEAQEFRQRAARLRAGG